MLSRFTICSDQVTSSFSGYVIFVVDEDRDLELSCQLALCIGVSLLPDGISHNTDKEDFKKFSINLKNKSNPR